VRGSDEAGDGRVSGAPAEEWGRGFLGKVVAGIGAAVAGVFAVGKITQRKQKNYSFEGQQGVNPVLEGIQDRRGMEMFIARKQEGSINVHMVTPNPVDYFGGWKAADESDEKRLFFRGVEKKRNTTMAKPLTYSQGFLPAGLSGLII